MLNTLNQRQHMTKLLVKKFKIFGCKVNFVNNQNLKIFNVFLKKVDLVYAEQLPV